VAAQRPTAAGRRVLFTALALLALCSPVLATDPRDSTVQRAGSASVASPPPADETSVPALPGRADEQVGPAMVWIVLFSLTPVIVVCATAYLKISVVLSLLRNALATPQVPSDTVIAGISLALAIFVMGPVVRDARQQVARCGADLNTASGALAAVTAAAVPLRAFLQRNSRPSDIELFASFAGAASEPEPDTVDVLLPAFVVGQLREGFVCGFLLFLPFLVVDLVVANILMSLGMVMVSPSSIALPFKLMLFAMIDGWSLLAQGLALSFK
jgi:flagellar biosynthesis protein FliP